MATEFQQQVWRCIDRIPNRRVTTYSDIACAIGRPRAGRAVGTACAQNPALITTPCHRVVCSNGSVGQYASGTDAKIQLLQTEGITIVNGVVQDMDRVRYTMQ